MEEEGLPQTCLQEDSDQDFYILVFSLLDTEAIVKIFLFLEIHTFIRPPLIDPEQLLRKGIMGLVPVTYPLNNHNKQTPLHCGAPEAK